MRKNYLAFLVAYFFLISNVHAQCTNDHTRIERLKSVHFTRDSIAKQYKSELDFLGIMPHDTIALSQYLHLETFAQLTGTCVEELHLLNPSLRRNAVPEIKNGFILKMPVASKAILAQNRIGILDSSSKVGRKEF